MDSDFSLARMVEKQVSRVLKRGQRFDRFDQLRQRHFWSTYLFAHGAGNPIPAGQYDVFKSTPGLQGQGYPSGVTLSLRETNWRNSSRVPDNQNFAISEVGVSLIRPPCVDDRGVGGAPANAPTDGIYANLPPSVQALVHPRRTINPTDAAQYLYGTVLEFSYLTNSVPLGLCADWSQSAGAYAQEQATSPAPAVPVPGPRVATLSGPVIERMGDPTNGIPAAAFRRKLEVPILLQHGEAMGMRFNVPVDIPTLTLDEGGAGWVEFRVDWWATESFVEYS